MIIVNLNGGLGNQMFQYALGRSLSIEKNTELLIHTQEAQSDDTHNGFELARVFGVKAKVACDKDLSKVLGVRSSAWLMKKLRSRKLGSLRGNHYIVEPHFNYYGEVFNAPCNSFIRGFWQSEQYFLNVRETILQEFVFENEMSNNNLNAAEIIKQHISISIHVRRGNYVSNPKVSKVHGVMPIEYYKKAIAHINNEVQNAFFILFSDDSDWVKNHLAKNLLPNDNYIVIDHNKGDGSYNDMRLMSLCSHNIIANSSFSWWGAWLNQHKEKIVIAPENWFSTNKNTKDLYPKSWKIL